MSRLTFTVLIRLAILAILHTSVSTSVICNFDQYPKVNIAYKKPATQSPGISRWGPEKGNDGNADTNMKNNHCFKTGWAKSPWWEVDLRDMYCISQVNITNRGVCCADRAKNVEIAVSRDYSNWSVVWYQDGQMGDFLLATFKTAVAVAVRVTFVGVNDYMRLCEVEVYA